MAGGLNLYCYVGNDPINRADPPGLWWKTALLVVAAVAVVAVVAPVLLPVLAIGAVVGGVVEAVPQETFCLSCILLASLRGAAIGMIGSAPFLFVAPAAGVGVFTAAGAASGLISYAADVASSDAAWSWTATLFSVGLGRALGAAGKYIGGKIRAQRANA